MVKAKQKANHKALIPFSGCLPLSHECLLSPCHPVGSLKNGLA
ncbi:hypothetical protein [Kingella sp. (in: b-proteobacteria)]|nr:hypothetical protein [Kingella sp. (in: b-proteobacteria)]MDO4656972.1 hypothetical protein [Kingella sp. (in: b-proteobacteria)]